MSWESTNSDFNTYNIIEKWLLTCKLQFISCVENSIIMSCFFLFLEYGVRNSFKGNNLSELQSPVYKSPVYNIYLQYIKLLFAKLTFWRLEFTMGSEVHSTLVKKFNMKMHHHSNIRRSALKCVMMRSV